jgi:hypothetical protein
MKSFITPFTLHMLVSTLHLHDELVSSSTEHHRSRKICTLCSSGVFRRTSENQLGDMHIWFTIQGMLQLSKCWRMDPDDGNIESCNPVAKLSFAWSRELSQKVPNNPNTQKREIKKHNLSLFQEFARVTWIIIANPRRACENTTADCCTKNYAYKWEMK